MIPFQIKKWRVFLSSLFLILLTVPAYSKTASIVIDSDSGEIISSDDANHLWYPASLTKIMTLYLTFEALEAGVIKLNDTVIVSKKAANQAKVRLGLKQGDKITIEQAILALTIHSANDAAFLLAEHLAKSEEDFAEKMTRKAHFLGMSNTLFLNSSGLPNNKQTTTAWDMAVLAQAILQNFPDYYHYFSAASFVYKKQYQNSNNFLQLYDGSDGLKTGFTCASAYNLMISVKRGDTRLIAILLGAENKQDRTNKMITLLNDAFAHPDNGLEQNIAQRQEKSSQQATIQLTSAQCNQALSRIVIKKKDKKEQIINGTLILGAFQEKEQANAIVENTAATMEQFLPTAYPVIKQHEMNGMLLWHAVWTNLDEVDAGKACKALWQQDRYCQSVPPTIFSDDHIL